MISKQAAKVSFWGLTTGGLSWVELCIMLIALDLLSNRFFFFRRNFFLGVDWLVFLAFLILDACLSLCTRWGAWKLEFPLGGSAILDVFLILSGLNASISLSLSTRWGAWKLASSSGSAILAVSLRRTALKINKRSGQRKPCNLLQLTLTLNDPRCAILSTTWPNKKQDKADKASLELRPRRNDLMSTMYYSISLIKRSLSESEDIWKKEVLWELNHYLRTQSNISHSKLIVQIDCRLVWLVTVLPLYDVNTVTCMWLTHVIVDVNRWSSREWSIHTP